MVRIAYPHTVAVVATVLSAFAYAAAQPPNAHIGVWRINLAKSQYDPGPAPQRQTVIYRAAQGALHLISDGVDSQGTKTHAEYTARVDGQPVPMTGNPNGDMVAIKQIDGFTMESVWTLNGKATITSRSTVSADGKTRTVTQVGTNAAGQRVNNTIVYER
jgi:hypothetical protein